MVRWVTACVLGLALLPGDRAVVAEDDLFAEVPPPASIPAVTLPLTPRPAPRLRDPSIEPTPAERQVQQRAAQAASDRQARITKRKQTPVSAPPLFFPAHGPLSDPALLHNDPGIAIAFRPILLSEMAPSPAWRWPVPPRRVRPLVEKHTPPAEPAHNPP